MRRNFLKQRLNDIYILTFLFIYCRKPRKVRKKEPVNYTIICAINWSQMDLRFVRVNLISLPLIYNKTIFLDLFNKRNVS